MKELDRAVAMLNFVERVLMVQEETRLNLLGGHDLLRPVIPQLIQLSIESIMQADIYIQSQNEEK